MDISEFQYGLITNLMSLTVAGMGAAALFFFLSRSQVAPAYRPALLISGLVVAIACYHYFRIYESFAAAYVLEAGTYVASGKPFNDAYRYADWLLTVPLLIVELIAVMNLHRDFAHNLTVKLAVAAVAMIALGYPGEVAETLGQAALWWALAMIPFLYIVGVLFTQFRTAVDAQPATVQPLVKRARFLVVASWSFYPVAYLGGLGASAAGETLLQVGYTFADLIAKVGLGLFIYAIARAKSEADGYRVAGEPRLAAVNADSKSAA